MKEEWDVECANCGSLNRFDLEPSVGDYSECYNCMEEFRINNENSISKVDV